MGRRSQRSFEVPPSAARLTSSLRDIGYDFPTAIADLVDNSIVAGASRVDVDIEFDGLDSWVTIADDGDGMTANGLLEAMRFGSRRDYGLSDLGRYGLGLKTASLSQCRSLTVVTRRSPTNRVISRRTMDLDMVEQWDAWMVVEATATEPVERASDRLNDGPGTVVVWEKLDRILPERDPEGGWARRRLATHAERLSAHLGMVFHRFLEGTAATPRLTIMVNGVKVRAWNPFAPKEPATIAMPEQVFELRVGNASGEVRLRPFVLPHRDRFSTPAEFERLSGPAKWNRMQGLYAYRADRLVQWGGWNGLRAIDEHTKLARAALDFDTDLDEAFHINVAKMRVTIPAELKQMLDRPIHELCVRAGDVYRRTTGRTPLDLTEGSTGGRRGHAPAAAVPRNGSGSASMAGLALTAAAIELGHGAALGEIVDLVRSRDPEILATLGLP